MVVSLLAVISGWLVHVVRVVLVQSSNDGNVKGNTYIMPFHLDSA